ncbi:MAG: hypothetical protein SX243_00230 [Acidobacteriota bacterium]|nr:hypothetical protein [Acidobacteriota bacterium]
MKLPFTVKTLLAVGTALAVCLALTPAPVSAQSFSITFQGPTNGIGGIGPGDILVPTAPAPGLGPLPAPTVAITNWALGIAPPPTWNLPELDAVSFGRVLILTDNGAGGWGSAPGFRFSVDPYAGGIAGSPAAPNVFSEGVFGPAEASADQYDNLPLPLAPVGPAVVFGNTIALDGNGLAPPAAVPGIGLIEPNPPTPGFPDPGDTLDALAMVPPAFPVYFSLDAAWGDPLDGPPANLGSAPANGFLPGDVIVTPAAGAAPFVFAPAAALGLGPQDDLDALTLMENGDGFFSPSKRPFDWQTDPRIDMLFFSVRRGSPIIGALDSVFGIPITEGDILIPPVNGAATPGIFVAAEALGLVTNRGGGGNPPFPPHSDDLDALALPPC